jgi:hypothetical protein
MKQTKKINKKKIFNKKKTCKRRFNKKGGVQKKCDVCGIAFHMTGTLGAPPKSQLFGAELFEDHIKTHPICKYCNTKHLDVNRLIEHIRLEHPDNYNTAQKIKFGILNERNLLDELRNKNSSVLGQSPEFNLFYDAIEKKINTKPVSKEVAKSEKKIDMRSKQRENNNKKESEIAEQLESSRRAIAEEQRLLREAAEKRKQEKLEAAEKEAQMLKEQAQALKKEKEKEKKLLKD